MPTLDGTKAMRRQIVIEVLDRDPSGASGLTIFQRKDKFTTRLIARDVDEGQVLDLLTERQQRRYKAGSWQFKVSAQLLCDAFQWLA